MQDSFITYMLFAILVLLVAFIGLEIYLFMNKRKDKGQDKLAEETNRLREEVNKSIGDMSSSFNQQFTSLSKDVTRDMTRHLLKWMRKWGPLTNK